MEKVALITGIGGQDAAYLAKNLLEKGFKVIGTSRRSSADNLFRLKSLGIENELEVLSADVQEYSRIQELVMNIKPTQFYNLAAQSFVADSFKSPIYTSLVNGTSVLNILESIRLFSPETKFYQASTSEMFGESGSSFQNEKTIFHPRSPYATSKAFAHYSVQNYREAYNLHAVSGILFNHESPLRGEEFITRKITLGLSKIFLGKQKILKVGNIYSKRDWGYAEDYVQAMWKMIQSKKPKDYVIATGKNYSVKQFINECVKILKLKTKWVGKGLNEKLINLDNNKTIISIDKEFFRPSEVENLKGNFFKAKKELNWTPKTNFSKLVKMMIKSDLDYVKKN